MDILQLQYFLEVARMGNMTAAASSMHVAQSSVSRSIARLEEELGVPLFERNGRGIFLNDYGRAFYDRASNMMRELGEGEQELKQMRDQFAGRVSVSTSSARQINRLMMQFMEKHPDALFRQRRLTDMQDIKAKLESGVLDYALTYGPLPDPEYRWDPMIREEFYILMQKDHPLSQKQAIDIADLEGEHILMNDVDDPDLLEAQCRQAGFDPIFSFIGNEYEVIGPMVERGLGIALIPTLSLYDMRNNLPLENLGKSRVVKIDDDAFQRQLGVLYRKHHYFSPAAKAFYRSLTEYFRVIELEMK